MLAALLAWCERWGWESERAVRALEAVAASCAAQPSTYRDVLALARGLEQAAGAGAAASLAPQLAAAFVGALPAAAVEAPHAYRGQQGSYWEADAQVGGGKGRGDAVGAAGKLR